MFELSFKDCMGRDWMEEGRQQHSAKASGEGGDRKGGAVRTGQCSWQGVWPLGLQK